MLTPLVQAQIDAKAKEAGITTAQASSALLSEKQPSKTFATPTEIGELASFLCSKHAAQITGAWLKPGFGVSAFVSSWRVADARAVVLLACVYCAWAGASIPIDGGWTAQ